MRKQMRQIHIRPSSLFSSSLKYFVLSFSLALWVCLFYCFVPSLFPFLLFMSALVYCRFSKRFGYLGTFHWLLDYQGSNLHNNPNKSAHTLCFADFITRMSISPYHSGYVPNIYICRYSRQNNNEYSDGEYSLQGFALVIHCLKPTPSWAV